MASRAKPKVYIQKLPHSRYRLIVDNKPYVVKGVCYNPISIGQGNDYDWWSDPGKPWLIDGKLMQQMGVNTIRLYQAHENIEEVKQVIRDLYNLYGIRTILGHWLGFWNYPCPLYGETDFREQIKKEILEMVANFKDEPGVLLWILGNENNYSCWGRVNPWSTDAIDKEPDPQKQRAMRAELYYGYVNELAREIHKIDPNHPVALGNGELLGLEYANKSAPDVDLVACIIYRGKTFGNLFRSLKMAFDKPVLLSEFGADSYDASLDKEDQNMQAFFLESQWRQIYENLADNEEGEGNCLGGTIFEWSDEWWKHNESDAQGWSVHDTESNWTNGSYYFDIQAKGGKNMNEEWFGLVALSPELENGLNKRAPRKAYYVIREFWKNPDLKKKGKK
jgi:endo-1,4-beta-mannosidase